MPEEHVGRRLKLLLLINIPVVLWYFGWLLNPDRIGHPVLFGLLVVAELFNLTQGLGFWWTCLAERRRPLHHVWVDVPVDVLIPVYDEPVEVVAPTVRGATEIEGSEVNVYLLDDGNRPEMRDLAGAYGVHYLARGENTGAKAGNLNNALRRTSAPFVVVFDSDHVPRPEFLQATLAYFRDPYLAFVQTPQCYANAHENEVAAAAWAQQSLFFGGIARGKDGHGAMFCCGTNVVFRRSALEQVGGFPEESLTEDFELSIDLHEQGWRSVYVPRVLAQGLGPQDMSSYVSQQSRWARGCIRAVGRVLRARLPRRLRIQYLLSSMFFLTGWTLLIYMAFPVIRILTGAQPLNPGTADQFLLHFIPYFAAALFTLAVIGRGSFAFSGFALLTASFWVHIQASLAALLRIPSRFVVTPKTRDSSRQPRAVLPALAVVAVLGGSAVYGLTRQIDPATINNVAFAALHIVVLLRGALPALRARPLGRTEAITQELQREVA